jgi:hypothetical protein
MGKQASTMWKRLRRSLAACPARFAGGSAVSDPLGLLAVERERRRGDHSIPHPHQASEAVSPADRNTGPTLF